MQSHETRDALLTVVVAQLRCGDASASDPTLFVVLYGDACGLASRAVPPILQMTTHSLNANIGSAYLPELCLVCRESFQIRGYQLPMSHNAGIIAGQLLDVP